MDLTVLSSFKNLLMSAKLVKLNNVWCPNLNLVEEENA